VWGEAQLVYTHLQQRKGAFYAKPTFPISIFLFSAKRTQPFQKMCGKEKRLYTHLQQRKGAFYAKPTFTISIFLFSAKRTQPFQKMCGKEKTLVYTPTTTEGCVLR
jgi:hypothetical protein